MDSDWQCSSVKSRDTQLLEKGYFSDCSFEVGETREIFFAHKILLAKSSPVFENMLFGSMAENTDNAIRIPDVQSKIFLIMLKYVYTDEIDLKSYEVAGDLIYVAKKYMLNDLKKTCKDFLIDNVSTMNALKVIRENTRSVLNSPDFVDIDILLMTVIIEQETLEITEIELFQLLESLAKIQGLIEATDQEQLNGIFFDKESKKQLTSSKKTELWDKFRNAAKKIHYLSMTANDFANGPAFSKLLLAEDAFSILACLASSDNIEKYYPIGFAQSKRQISILPRVSFHIISNGFAKGDLVIELRSDLVPRTVRCIQNIFIELKGSLACFKRPNGFWGQIILEDPKVMSTICSYLTNAVKYEELGSVAIGTSNGKTVLQIKLESNEYFVDHSVVVGKVISGLHILNTKKPSNLCGLIKYPVLQFV